ANTLYLKAGKVGIGTTNPTQELDVNGNIRVGGTLYFSDGSGMTTAVSPSSGITSSTDLGLGADSDGNGSGVMTFSTATLERMRIDNDGNIGIGIDTPTAKLNIMAGTTVAGTAPIKLTSGDLLTIPEAGAIEFLDDVYYGTMTTGAERKQFAFSEDISNTYIPYSGATTNVDLGSNDLTVDTNTLFVDSTNHRVGIGTTSPTARLTLPAGTTTAGTAPLKFTSGDLLDSPEIGAMEFNNDDLYFNITTPWLITTIPYYPPVQNATYVKATSSAGSSWQPYYATDPAKSLINTHWGNSWYAYNILQRFHIDLGSAKLINNIYYENFHSSGGLTTTGVKNFTIWGSNNASDFNDTTYANDGTWVQLTTSQTYFEQHIASNVPDPKYISVINTTAYRYYAFKFADNYGDGTNMAVRRVELQNASSVDYRRPVVLADGVKLTEGRIPYAGTGGRLIDSSNLTFDGTTLNTSLLASATSITTPKVIGGTTTTSPLILQSTSGVGIAGADIIFKTGNNGATETMRILNSGNLGIGTTNPTGNLSVTQTATATGILKGIVYTGAVNTNQTASTEIPSLTITTAGRQWATGALATQREVLFTQPTYSFVGASTITNAATVGIVGAPINGTNATITNTHGLLIQAGIVGPATNSYGLTVNSQTGASNNYAAVFMGGNVGIGTTAPTQALDVNGNIRVGGTLYFSDGSGMTTAVSTSSGLSSTGDLNMGADSDADTSGAMIFSTATLERIRVLNNGNVGIGTSIPGQLLSVAGVIESTTGGFKFPDGTTQDTAGSTASGTENYLSKFTSSSALGDSIIFDNGTNVGIGTTTPTNILSLGNTQAQKIWIEDTASGTVGRDLTISAGSTVAGSPYVDGGNLILSTGAGTGDVSNDILFYTATPYSTGATYQSTLQTISSKGIITGAGFFGMGTLTPGLKGEFKGNLSAPASSGSTQNGSLRLSQTSGAAVLDFGIGSIGGLGGAWLQAGISTNLSVHSASSLLLNPIGSNVGIGLNGAPVALLDVNGIGVHSAGAVATPSFAFRTDLNTGMWSSGADTINFSTGGSEKTRIDSLGNVGIGLTPGYRLHVSDATTAGIVGAFTNSDGTCTLDPGDVSGWSCPSDINLKKDIETLSSGLFEINQLRTVSYRLKNESEDEMLSIGLIAQEVELIFPKLVRTQLDGTLSLNYGGLTPYIINAIQELDLKIESLTDTNIPLLDDNDDLTFVGKFFENMSAWLANAGNKITRIFTGEVCLTEAGEETVCLNRTELKSLKALLANPSTGSESSTSVLPIEEEEESGGGNSIPTEIVPDPSLNSGQEPEVEPEVTPEPEVTTEEIVPENPVEEEIIPEIPAEEIVPEVVPESEPETEPESESEPEPTLVP
ncbi:MAG: tail fiber domain-containing protein, partial [Candidatus Paceibacterota bacterium]